MAAELDTVALADVAPPTTAELLEGPGESLRRALTLLGVLSSLDGLRFKPDDALLYAQYCEAVAAAIGSAIAKVEAQTVGLRTLRALLDAGGLEYAPRGQTERLRSALTDILDVAHPMSMSSAQLVIISGICERALLDG